MLKFSGNLIVVPWDFSEMSVAALKRASDAVRAVQSGYNGTYSAAPQRTNVAANRFQRAATPPSTASSVAAREKINPCLMQGPGFLSNRRELRLRPGFASKGRNNAPRLRDARSPSG